MAAVPMEEAPGMAEAGTVVYTNTLVETMNIGGTEFIMVTSAHLAHLS